MEELEKEIISAIKKGDVNNAMRIIGGEFTIFDDDGTAIATTSSFYKNKHLTVLVRRNGEEETLEYYPFTKEQALEQVTKVASDAYYDSGGLPNVYNEVRQIVKDVLKDHKFGSNRTILYAGLLLGAAFIFFKK